ncbi:MAG: hypothetical protein ACR2MS_09410 [Weeksellaceae bacterium]
MKLKTLLLLSFIMISCNPSFNDDIDEDYESLFPFDGIEKPEISYDEMKVQLCNPELDIERFQFPGVKIEPVKEYTVTLKCVYEEGINYDSKYIVRYVDADEKIKTLGSDRNDYALNSYLNSGEEREIEFIAYSGFPIYLSVDGVGSRNSSIKASITAVSEDGFITTPTLFIEQNQNKEGLNRIESPYCEYIILP